MEHTGSSYGLWTLVVLNVAIFVMFAFSFFAGQRARLAQFRAFTAFIVALFVEMYGFPLTIYFLSGWLGQKLPGVDLLNHNAGHLLELLFGWGGDPHLGPFHILSYLFIGGGFWLLAAALARALRGPAAGAAWRAPVFTLGAASAVHRLRADHVRLSPAMADLADAVDVPGACGDVCPPGAQRGAGKRTPFWTGLGAGMRGMSLTAIPTLGRMGSALSDASDDQNLTISMKSRKLR